MRRLALTAVPWSLLALLGAVLVTPGCARREKDPAVAAYERFVAGIRAGRGDLVWQSLTPGARAHLAADLGLAPEATPEEAAQVLAVRPGWQFELDLPQRATLDKGSQTDERRVVLGPLAGRTWRIVVRRVDAAWLIDLFESEPVES
ncbi:MAG: hypothetical protein R3F60_15315 [bacterium]